jgi:translocator assembly and maintenance protein 41
MRVGENPGKIGNIVAAQYDRFATLYTPFFTSTSFASVLARPSPGSDHFELDASPRARGAMARKLPSGLRDRLQAAIERTQRLGTATGRDAAEEPTGADEAARWTKIAKDADFQSQLSKSASAAVTVYPNAWKTALTGLTDIVSGPAFYQSVKGVVSVGFTKGVRYVGPKLRKRWLPSSSS